MLETNLLPYLLPWEPTTFFFRGYDPYFEDLKYLHFSMGFFGVQR